MKTLLPLLAVAALLSAQTLRAENPVIVHEWGTFTSLQDENGKALGGINVDDEPVPSFVWNLAGVSVIPVHGGEPFADTGLFGLPPYNCPAVKGWANGDPNVTMRLETPVIYIYPPKGEMPSPVPPLDVHVDFHGGVLSQYYPIATVTGLPANVAWPSFQGSLTSATTLGLTWKGTRIGASDKLLESSDPNLKGAPSHFLGRVVETDNKVWTTPRETSAPLLQVRGSIPADAQHWETITQTEHFLFYRGVGHLDSPLTINSTFRIVENVNPETGPDHMLLSIGSQGAADKNSAYSDAWLVQIDEDGSCAFFHSDLAKKGLTNGWLLQESQGSAKEWHFDRDNLFKLKSSMQTALVKAGLYPDEASAMLRTWELSYFKSPGLRFFYIVPRQWVDQTLPLKITGAPVQITRVMVGRIELISDEQQAALARLEQEAYPDLPGLKKLAQAALKNGKYSEEEQQAFITGARPLSDLGITLSASVRDYLSLGRFRDALLIHEQQLHPSASLARFIKENGLAAN